MSLRGLGNSKGVCFPSSFFLTQAVLAEYGKKRLERQNSCQDPRLVDMDDNGRENQRINVDANDNTDKDVLAKKTDHLLSLSPTNCVPNGHYKRPRLSFGHASQQPSGRAVLEPIPLAKLSRSRRLSSEAVIQLAEACSKGNSEETPSSSSDELLTKLFNNSCMEALNLLKNAYDQKLVSVVIIPISFRLISHTMAKMK